MIDINRDGMDWMIIRRWAVEQIETGRTALEKPGLPETESEFLRGQISAWRLMIREAEPEMVEAPTIVAYD